MNWPGLLVGAVLGVAATTTVGWMGNHWREWWRELGRRRELHSDTSDLAQRIRKLRRSYRFALTPDQFMGERKDYGRLRSSGPDKLADFHKKEADFLWPRQDKASSYRTAYHYTLAYEAAQEAGGDYLAKAARWAHFAGHRFRQLDEFALAGEAYEASARLAHELDPAWAVRSARRAVGCWAEVAEYERARKVAGRYALEWPAERSSGVQGW